MVRIMVVDDDQFNRQEVKSLLERAKTPGQKNNGRTLRLVPRSENRTARDINLDVTVPELLGQTQSRPAQPDQLVVISPRSDEVLVLEPLGSGTKAYFLKQGRHEMLDAAINDLLLAA